MRKGSALLVVIGMVAFIVISAIGFSAYMRTSRLPSSYTLRSSATRLLVKAGLAQSIDLVDEIIGNDPCPNYRLNAPDYNYNARNIWQGRVLIGSNFVETAKSVSPLTLEGLAYLPPGFINEVRYFSRRSSAAVWHQLSFDSGRFAFCAVDVSDCFDVNKVAAGLGRDSSDEGRVSLSYCFEMPDDPDKYIVTPSAWDDFVSRYYDENNPGSKVPFISLADFNLALANGGPGKMISPFCRYIKNGTPFVTDNSDNPKNTDGWLLRHMNFVTDSYYPLTNDTSAINLARATDQPFYGFPADTEDKNEMGLEEIFNRGQANRFLSRFCGKRVGGLLYPELALLYDYLDLDSVPASLALPTVERNPMIVGVGLLSNGLRLFVKKEPRQVTSGSGENASVITVTPYKLQVKGQLGIRVGLAYPFKYEQGDANRTWGVEAFATIAFVKAGGSLSLRGNGKSAAPGIVTKDAWSKPTPKTPEVYGDGKLRSVMSVRTPSPQPVKEKKSDVFKKGCVEEQDAVLADVSLILPIDIDFSSEMAASANDPQKKVDTCVFRTITQKTKSGSETTIEAKGQMGIANVLMDGQRDVKEYDTDKEDYVPVIQLWVRVIDQDKNVVDQVPAYWKDDEKQSLHLGQTQASQYAPLLRFYDQRGESALKVRLDRATMDALANGGADIVTAPAAYLADDPRFNYAPENLIECKNFDLTGGKDLGQYWFETQTSKNGDGDIFMATSDAGYLQSAYELAFLLNLHGAGNHPMGGVLTEGYNGAPRAASADLAAADAMWTTFSQYDCNGEANDIAPMGIINAGKGARVSPYTHDRNVMMAALANTPISWWAASTNDTTTAKQQMLDNLQEANKYTFSEHNGAPQQVSRETLEALADKFIEKFSQNGTIPWERVFDGLDAGESSPWDTANVIHGVDFSEDNVTLHSVDRKFLHGYWRECFANRQQLFLIFVRAEPMMMGGGFNLSPPQVGGRAVALVWRDPTPPRQNGAPHRTRVLFYRHCE